jgi:putative copper export protein
MLVSIADGPDAFALAERTASLVALIVVFGAAVFRMQVVRPLYGPAGAPLFAARLDGIARRLAMLGAAALVLLALVRLHVQVTALFEVWTNVGVEELRVLLLHSTWGHAWLLQVGACAVIAAGPVIGRSMDVWMAAPLALSAALNGHAAASEPVALVVGMNAAHALAAGGWIGGVLLVLVATTLTPGNEELLQVLRRFNVVGLTCAFVLVATGIFAAWVHVGSFAAMFGTPYGVQFSIKLAFVLVTVALGARNSRWRRAGAGGLNAERVRRTVLVELAVALMVIIATARLMLLAPPTM